MSESNDSIVLESGAGTLTGPYLHHGICEPSDMVLIGDTEHGTLMLVVDDEDNFLRVYVAEADGEALSVPVPDLYDFLKLDRDDEDEKADFEGLARLGDRIYVIGSHSRSGKGKIRKSRHQFFALTAPEPGDALAFAVAPATASRSLMTALTDPALGLTAAIEPDRKEAKELAPEANGLNIEGLAVAPDRTSLLIGLRNPLTAEGRARVLRLEDPAGVVAGTSDPKIEPYADLDLDKRGIRCMVRLEDRKSYLLIAGPNASQGSFALYRWSGGAGEAPVRMVSFEGADIPADFRPEAVALDPDGRRLHLFSDDGDRVVEGVTKPNEPLKDHQPQSERFFRSWVFTPA